MPDLEACSKSGLDWGAQTWGRAGPILAGKKFRAWNLPQSSWITNPGGLKPPIILLVGAARSTAPVPLRRP